MVNHVSPARSARRIFSRSISASWAASVARFASSSSMQELTLMVVAGMVVSFGWGDAGGVPLPFLMTIRPGCDTKKHGSSRPGRGGG